MVWPPRCWKRRPIALVEPCVCRGVVCLKLASCPSFMLSSTAVTSVTLLCPWLAGLPAQVPQKEGEGVSSLHNVEPEATSMHPSLRSSCGSVRSHLGNTLRFAIPWGHLQPKGGLEHLFSFLPPNKHPASTLQCQKILPYLLERFCLLKQWWPCWLVSQSNIGFFSLILRGELAAVVLSLR